MAEVYNRVIFSGTLAGGEIWSCGLSFGTTSEVIPGVSSFQDLQTWATNILAINSGQGLPDDLHALMSDGAALTQVRTETVTAAGVVTGAAVAQPATPQPGIGAIKMPLQTALAFSIDTGRPGRSYAGRVYWPALGAGIDGSTGRITATNSGNYLAAFVTLVDDIIAAAPQGAALTMVVASAKLQEQTDALRVKLGDVLDTQRRRRDSLAETYVSQALS